MRKLRQWTLLFVAMATYTQAMAAASANDFYVELLRRGVSEVEAGRHESAVTPLRLAAFGLIDSVENYQIAQAYLVVALDRLNQSEPARQAALRIVAAEKVEPRFASLAIPDEIRTAFSTSVKKLLPAADASTLLAPAASTTQAKPIVPQANPPKKAAVEPTSRPVVEKPAATTPSTTSSAARRPDDSKAPPKPTPPAPAPKKPAIDVPARLTAGERTLIGGNLADARKIYRELLAAGGHDHATWIRVAEGLYRSRDFAGVLTAFQSVGTLRPGEEAYRYYIAVAYYESGQFDQAKRELAAVLPFIEVTPDVERYRQKIDAAR
ncbi:MAG TPA: hypothetical protein VFP80_09150 [Thermoanaerobaculia bacterium]|nr:hypothetical protein [Thermoanaerobaculia bacterium]